MPVFQIPPADSKLMVIDLDEKRVRSIKYLGEVDENEEVIGEYKKTYIEDIECLKALYGNSVEIGGFVTLVADFLLSNGETKASLVNVPFKTKSPEILLKKPGDYVIAKCPVFNRTATQVCSIEAVNEQYLKDQIKTLEPPAFRSS